MNFHIVSQVTIDRKADFVKRVFRKLSESGGKLTESYRVLETSWETLGDSSFSDSWIQVYFREEDDFSFFIVERYYDNEFVNDERAREIKVVTDFSDISKTVMDISKAVMSINND